MDASKSCTADGEKLPAKAVGNLSHLDVIAKLESGGTNRKYEGDEDEQVAPLVDIKDEKEQVLALVDVKEDEDKVAALLDLKDDKDKEQVAAKDDKDKEQVAAKDDKDKEQAALLDLKDDKMKEEQQVRGWIAESGTSLREQQKTSQAKKAENAAAKKGLGFFCYETHGAYRPPM